MTCIIDTKSKRHLSAKLAARLAISAFLVLGTFVASASAAEHGGGGHGGGGHGGGGHGGGGHGGGHGGGGHRGGGGGGGYYYRAPPVVYGSPYYYPPPVIYPGIGITCRALASVFGKLHPNPRMATAGIAAGHVPSTREVRRSIVHGDCPRSASPATRFVAKLVDRWIRWRRTVL